MSDPVTPDPALSDPVLSDSAPPRITVVSAWFNRCRDLEASVMSLLDQEDVSFEFVIVDDCSTDETSERLAAIDHPRLRVIRNETNLGFTNSIRRAIEAGRGAYVALHGAGDMSLPGRLRRQADFLDAHPDHVVVGTGVWNHDMTTGQRTEAAFAPLGGSNTPYTHGEVMIRRSAYERVGGYRPVFQYSQDNDLWRRLGEIGLLGRIEEPLYERRIFSDGVGGSPAKMAQQAVFSNLGVYAHQERLAGRRDPVDKVGAAALLMQARTPRVEARVALVVRKLLQQRRFADAKAALDTVPLGLLSWKLMLVYLALAPFHRRPLQTPVPPVVTSRPARPD